MEMFTAISINGEKWTAYKTDAKREERRWSLQCHGVSSIPGVIAFYSASLDAAVERIHAGK